MEQGKIVHGHYVQGDIKFAVNPSDGRKTLAAVDSLSNEDKTKLATLNNIPVDNANRRAVTEILKSVVQNAWYLAKDGIVPSEVQVAHNARLARYKAELAVPTSELDFLSRKTRAISKTRKVLLYTVDEAKYEANWKEYRSQSYLVIRTMLDLGAVNGVGKSVRDVIDNCKETRETTAPTRNGIGQIFKRLTEAGIVTLINPEDARKKVPAKKAPAPSPKKTKK